MSGPSIVWLRDDLRLADNPALRAAVQRGEPVVVLYLLDEVSRGIRQLGGATRWWLHGSLTHLDASLREFGGRLTLKRGAAEEVIPALVTELDAGAVFWNRRYGAARDIESRVELRWDRNGLGGWSGNGNADFVRWSIGCDSEFG